MAEAQKTNLTKTERSIFEDAVSKARSDLSLVAYQEGLDHVRTGRWHEARTALEESLRLDSNAAHSPQAQCNLARWRFEGTSRISARRSRS
ncbi:MAG: hypothetical protein R3B07_16355 [Polyangiaceae bacterium]